MNRRIKQIAAITFLIAVIVGTFFGCSNDRRREAAAPESGSNIALIFAQRTNVPDWLEAVGTVRAEQTSQVASQMTGNIVKLQAREGDRVQRGQILATIDDAQPRAAVERATAAVTAANKEVSAAESDFALAEATVMRYQQLYEKKSVSPQEFDEIKGRYELAQARRDMARAGQAQAAASLTQAQTSLGYAQIRAPFAGVITEKKADMGTFVSPGMPLFTLEDTRSHRLETTVDESEIRLVRAGQTVSIYLDAIGNTEFSGRVAQIVPTADAVSRTFLVKIALPLDGRLRSGLFGRARFSRGEHPALLIPQTALVDRGQLQGVYVIDTSGIAQLRYITLGNPVGPKVEVLSGLQDGERLIADPGGRELGGKYIELHP